MGDNSLRLIDRVIRIHTDIKVNCDYTTKYTDGCSENTPIIIPIYKQIYILSVE